MGLFLSAYHSTLKTLYHSEEFSAQDVLCFLRGRIGMQHNTKTQQMKKQEYFQKEIPKIFEKTFDKHILKVVKYEAVLRGL